MNLFRTEQKAIRMRRDAELIVRQAIDAANASDTDAFLQCFEETGRVDDWGRVFVGRDAIRQWSDAEFIGMNVALDVQEVVTSCENVTIAAEVGGSGFNGLSHFAFTSPKDLIRSMTITA